MSLLRSCIFLVMIFAVTIAHSQESHVTRASGGSIKTELSRDIALNDESSLTREWITIHNTSLPVDIEGTVGVDVKYQEETRWSRGGFNYQAQYTIATKEAISAIKVIFLTFDIWGNHSKSLSSTDIVDLAGGITREFKSEWNLFSENEAAEFYASIAYVAQVRTQSGKVIKADPALVLEEARKFSGKFTEQDLEPKPKEK